MNFIGKIFRQCFSLAMHNVSFEFYFLTFAGRYLNEGMEEMEFEEARVNICALERDYIECAADSVPTEY